MLARHDEATAERVERPLERATSDARLATSEMPARVCLAELRVDLGLARGDRTTPRLLHDFDSLLATVRAASAPYVSLANINLARLQEASGDLVSALRAARRHEYHWLPGGTMGLSTFLLRQGQLAARLGDTASALRAYRHYLVLRSNPDPELVPQRDSVRGALLRLTEHH